MEQSKRIRLLDVLRGVAIIGTLGTNIWLFAQPGEIMSLISSQNWFDSFEVFIKALLSVFINGKLLGLLTIMFGIGLELKYRKAKRDGLPWLRFYIWTMSLLFLDGLLHFIFVFEYDILMSYALTGVFVAFLIQAKEQRMNKWMKGAAIVHVIGVTLISILWVNVLRDERMITETAMQFRKIQELYIDGSYWEQVTMRLRDFISLRFEAIAILFMNIALYIVGIHLFRKGAFAQDEKGQRIRRKLLKWGIGAGVPLNMLLLVPGGYFDLSVRYLFAPILSLGYIGLIAWILEKKWWQGLFYRFEWIGKSALSCYVLQNILASILFYSWGLGLAPVHNVYGVLASWFGISIILMFVAQLFVKTMGTGPLEWVWRKLSYMPFTRKT